MKSFLIKLLIFCSGLALLYPIKTIYLLRHDRYKKLVLGKEIYYSIDKSKKRNKKVKTLIIGDSVGQQIFKNDAYNDSICSLTCNQSISLGGQYFLLEDFLKINPEVEKVVLIYTPKAFKNNLDQQYTFQYFLKPIYNDEYKSRFSSAMMSQAKKVPFYYLAQFPPVLTSNWTPDVTYHDSTDSYYMSPISSEYLDKMVALCSDRHIRFLIVPTPSRESFKPLITAFSRNNTYSNYDFKDYFARVEFIPDSCFLDDVHLKAPLKFKDEYLKVFNDL